MKRFSVGRVFEMAMEIKPRTINGAIMSVHGRRDFVLLQLRNGSLELSVDNGKGIITTTYTPFSPWSFCDGQWHSIQCKFPDTLVHKLFVDLSLCNYLLFITIFFTLLLYKHFPTFKNLSLIKNQ